MTAIVMVALILTLGLAIDVSRFYMFRAGLQNAADAAALAAARELNSGSGGLTDAVAAATSGNLTNKHGFDRTGVTASNTTISTVEFAASLSGPWYVGAGNVPSGTVSSIKYVRVTTQSVSIPVLFAAKALGSSHPESAQAVAGMSVGLNTICDFFPIAVALTTMPANHEQLTFRYAGRDFRLTDVHGEIVRELLA
jgi:Flp pilus assembly protein TadG